MTDHPSVAARALEWAATNHPTASVQHRAAFANGVALLVTGESGGYGGPSIREHAIAWSLGTSKAIAAGSLSLTVLAPSPSPAPGRWGFDEAVRHCEAIAFGELDPELARAIARTETCRDDDPDDLALVGVDPAIAAIVGAWMSGEHGRAIALTHLWQAQQKANVCLVCGKRLAARNRSGYCTTHREHNPGRWRKKA